MMECLQNHASDLDLRRQVQILPFLNLRRLTNTTLTRFQLKAENTYSRESVLRVEEVLEDDNGEALDMEWFLLSREG